MLVILKMNEKTSTLSSQNQYSSSSKFESNYLKKKEKVLWSSRLTTFISSSQITELFTLNLNFDSDVAKLHYLKLTHKYLLQNKSEQSEQSK